MSVSRLQSFYPFSDELTAEIYKYSTELSLSMGEVLISNDTSTQYLFLLVTGRLRQIVSHSSFGNKDFSLSTYTPPFVAGYSTYLSGISSGSFTAAEDSLLLRIDSSVFFDLFSRHSELSDFIQSFLVIPDVWSILQTQSHIRLPDSIKGLRSWISSLHSRSLAVTLFPGVPSDLSVLRDYQTFAGDCNLYAYGTPLSFETLADLYPTLTSPLRLISLPKDLFDDASTETIPSKDPFVHSPTPPTVDTDKTHSDSDKSGLDDPIPFRHYQSLPGYVSETVSCFRTVADQLNIPLKPDLLERILSEQASKSDGVISLQLCAALFESLGLKTQLISIPISLITRIKTPSILLFDGNEMTVALAAKPNKLLVSRPRTAIETISIDQLTSLFPDTESIPILTLFKTHRTPQKKFTFKWFFPVIRKNKKSLIEVLIASLFVQLFVLMNPLIIQQIIDKVIGQNGTSTLPVLAVLLFSFSIFENVLTAVRTNLFIDTTNRIDITLGEQVIDHLLRLPLSYFDKRPVGELSSRLGELEQIRSFLTGTALTVIIDAVFSVLYIIVMLFYSWVLTIVALLVAPVLALLTFSLSPIIRSQLRSKANLNASTQNHLIEVLTGIQTVKAQNFELNARWRWKDRYSSYVAEGFKNAVTSTTANGLTQFLNQFSSLSVLCVGAYLVLQGELSLGQLIAFRIISGYVTTPLLRLSTLYQSFQQTSISLERLADIIDTPQESTDLDKKNIPMPKIAGHIVYDDVSFRFLNTGPLQLSKIHLEIESGEFVALVGQSGSGKSTLAKLLTRLYEPNSGRILIDSLDISKVELYSLRSQIGIVPQDSLLFEGTVQENIALSNPEASSDEVIAASKIACAHEFIMSLPSGYASSVGERGTALSGGQRQRIAIARTILQDPQLLIMDEATSALDYQTERLVSLNLMQHFRGRTVLFITHRLSSITHSDKIIMMHQGQVDEVGTHDELSNRKGRYYALFNQQGNS